MSGPEQEPATFTPTARQVRAQQALGVPVLLVLFLGLYAVLALVGGDSRDVLLSLGVFLALCLLVVLTLPWWTARTLADGPGIRLNHRPWVTGPANLVRWERISDIRTVRRRGRTHVVLSLDSGARQPLAVPYDGWWLARDPDFDAKVARLHATLQAKRPGWSIEASPPG